MAMTEPTDMVNQYAQANSQAPSTIPSIPSTSEAPLPLSTRSSRYEYRDSKADFINDMKCDVIVNQLHQRQQEMLWWLGTDPGEGVVLKKSRGLYTCAPMSLTDDGSSFFEAVQALNVKVAMTVTTPVVRIILHRNLMPFICIHDGLQIQVLPRLEDLPRCQKHQYAAFIADQGMLIVWDDNPRNIVQRVADLEENLVRIVWGGDKAYPEEDKKEEAQVEMIEVNGHSKEPEVEELLKERPIALWQAVCTACAITLTIGTLGLGWRQLAIQSSMDHTYLRLLIVLSAIPLFWLALFFFQCLVGDIAQLVGPVNQVKENSRYYSGKAPYRLDPDRCTLPHVTVQCPVYKEGLRSVIVPTIQSIKAAISTYERQGGTANIFINDDGLQLISLEDAQARRDFYEEHNIGWVARPKHNPNPNPNSQGDEKQFIRRGKFKKASNMNYALWVSTRVEDRLANIHRHESWAQNDETAAYNEALAQVVAEDGGQTWAEGNIRIGDYILIVDSDTRVPEDCFLDAVSEMEQSPNVGIVQFPSGVMNVTNSFFERGITFFTNLIYTQIKFAVASGDVAPFVGHNAVLRWLAVQSIGYECSLDNREKFWSESTVSEDFDMALRLQTAGYIVRLGGWTGDGFKEGVSLTVYDELARWEKYAYGCSELLFFPIAQWFRKGLMTPLFRRFLLSKVPLGSKFTISAYIGTYYAIGASLPLTTMNYFLIGWQNGHLDHSYLDSFRLFVSLITVFTVLGNLSLAVLRYRTGEKSVFSALVENISWIPLLFVFLGGLSLHVSKALLCHLFGVDITWGATNKEAEDIPFFQEIPRVLRRFKVTFILCVSLTLMITTMALVVPYNWRIDFLTAVFPLALLTFAHVALPTLLNPGLMRFTW